MVGKPRPVKSGRGAVEVVLVGGDVRQLHPDRLRLVPSVRLSIPTKYSRVLTIVYRIRSECDQVAQ